MTVCVIFNILVRVLKYIPVEKIQVVKLINLLREIDLDSEIG
jgi:hypothetical protein